MATLQRLFLFYLRTLAKLQLLKIRPTIVGITGSAGKTSTRDAVALVLQTKYRCKVSDKANSHTGIPLDILGLHLHDYSALDWLRVTLLAPLMLLVNWKFYQIYIVEMGVDSPFEPKNMGYLLKILRPHTGVMINALPVHSEPYDSLITATDPHDRSEQAADLIAAEKGRMIQALPPKGWAILNADDRRVAALREQTEASVMTVGHHGTDMIIRSHHYTEQGFTMVLEYKQAEYKLAIPGQVLGPAYATTFALAVAVGIAHGVPPAQAVQALQQYRLPPGRMSLLAGIKNSLILDGSYNASTQPMLDALIVLETLAHQGNRPAVVALGDMRELGSEAAYEHQLVAQQTAKIATMAVLVGPLMKEHALPILTKKLGAEQVQWFANSAQAAEFLKQNLPDNAITLVKASQNTLFLERISEALLADPTQANEVLCRRGEYWDQQRARFI